MKAKVLGLPADGLNPNEFGGLCSRAIKLEPDTDPTKGIATIATTANPALVLDWANWRIIRESLPMKYCELPSPNKLPLLDAHSRMSITNVMGSAKNFRVVGNALVCDTFVSESEPTILTKIKEKHIDSVSIGYETEKGQTVEVAKNKSVTIDGVAYTNNFEDEYPFIVRTWWKPKELSMVPIGADDQAKFRAMGAVNVEAILEQMNSLKNEIESLKQKPQTNQESTEQIIKPETATEQKAETKTEQKKEKTETAIKVNRAEYEKYKAEKDQLAVSEALKKAINYYKGKVK
jgi:hypothetical protein